MSSRNFDEVVTKNIATNGYPYSADQLNLVEESVANCDTVYSTNLQKKGSLIIDPSWIMDTYDKVVYAPKEIYVSPRSSKVHNLDHNDNILDDFDVKIKQCLPTTCENFKVVVTVPPRKQNNFLQICPPAINDRSSDLETTDEYEPIKINNLKLIRSNLRNNENFIEASNLNGYKNTVAVANVGGESSDQLPITSKEETTEKSAISYLDLVIDEHETKYITKPVHSNLSNVSFDVKIVATPPKPESECFAIVIPVAPLRNENGAGRS